MSKMLFCPLERQKSAGQIAPIYAAEGNYEDAFMKRFDLNIQRGGV